MIAGPFFIGNGRMKNGPNRENRKMKENITETQKGYIRRAIELALKGRGFTDPNPVVGAVVVKNGRIIGEGYHERYGQPHAERNALANCTEDPRGADIYVSLEPCCHYGKTPPCTEAIIERGIRRVFFGSYDPNPKVAGKSEGILRAAGVEVTGGVLREECDAINEGFFHYITTGTPYVTFKYAMTADGKIASATGKSQWISCEESRAEVHRMRHDNAGIMVGIGTVFADDPMLNCRIEGGKDPVRIICDDDLRIPMDSKIVKTAKEVPTIIATLEMLPEDLGIGKGPICRSEASAGQSAGADAGADRRFAKAKDLKDAGCDVLYVPGKIGTAADGTAKKVIDPAELMKLLGEKKISSVLLEGGGTIAWSALEAGAVQRVISYIAPKAMGGAGAKTPLAGAGADSPDEAVQLKIRKVTKVGDDIKIVYDVL